jgi:hypothetical protein
MLSWEADTEKEKNINGLTSLQVLDCYLLLNCTKNAKNIFWRLIYAI